MSREPLLYLEAKTIEDLYSGILENITKYRDGNFDDMVTSGGWGCNLSMDYEKSYFQELDSSNNPEAEVENSLLIWRALNGLTPAMAREDRIWTRISHVDCIDFSRKRWLKEKDDVALAKDVRTHFFAPSWTSCRDDHSIARLWWNSKIAKDLRPYDQRGALKLILKRADIRNNFVERAWTSSRNTIATSILDIMENVEWVTEKEGNFREFMKAVNRMGGGLVFELMSEAERYTFLERCVNLAKT
jgi:hypothetical protein